eukprot:935968-Pelagomonas_calceolata.AAC.4
MAECGPHQKPVKVQERLYAGLRRQGARCGDREKQGSVQNEGEWTMLEGWQEKGKCRAQEAARQARRKCRALEVGHQARRKCKAQEEGHQAGKGVKQEIMQDEGGWAKLEDWQGRLAAGKEGGL